MSTITIEYKASVKTACGFRGVVFTAEAERISEKRARVIDVYLIDGDNIEANMSRTGAKRQEYFGYDAARREEGKIKNLSSCTIL